MQRPNIKVVGVGNGGGNAVQHMIDSGLRWVNFICANTDVQALNRCAAPLKIQLGEHLTKGLGAGANPSIGREAALESVDALKECLADADMVFITAGMGGGTGTGAAPIIAQAAKEQGALTVGVVTKPFFIEGTKRIAAAEAGIAEFRQHVDCLITISNDRLMTFAPKKATFSELLKKTNESLHCAVKGISDMIMEDGLINLDIVDVRTALNEAGLALMGTGIASGKNRAREAAMRAITGLLWEDVSIDDAKAVLYNITATMDITGDEIQKIGTVIANAAHPEANVIAGMIYDENAGDDLRVTVIATGVEKTPERVSCEKLALQSVHVEGQLDGLLLSTVIRQNYLNNTGKNLEIVYTFPVSWGSSLLGMEVKIGSKRLQGVVIEKKEAEEKYEKAIEDGDTPVMVQESSPGLYTANLGNIKANESMSVEIRCAQLLSFEQDQIRVKIPTVIAPRYGGAHKAGGLAPHETDKVDLLAAYPLTVRLDITGESARAKITSPSHNVKMTATEGGLSVLLESGAMLDRDFILLLEGLSGYSFALSVPEEEQHTVLASFCPKLPVKADPLLLKILVDCSGSMSGDSIRQAQKALQSILRELSGQDFISVSRFGSEVSHASRKIEQCTPKVIKKFSALVDRLNADMGGTEMEKAVLSACKKVSIPENASLRPCLLLITDDLYWNDGSMLRQAMESGHRFFTIGVGSAPAECLLRQLAEKTGGACEFVTPNEDMAAVIVRMFHRMRVAQTNKLSIAWGSEPLWQSSMPLSIFDGETLHLFAAFAETPTQLPTLSWEVDGKTESAMPAVITPTENRDITRLGTAKRMQTVSKQEALALALKYQLVSDQSSLFLIYLREGEDKVADLPEIHQVPQMMAAGSHGYGTVSCFPAMSSRCAYACSFEEVEEVGGYRPQRMASKWLPAYVRKSRPVGHLKAPNDVIGTEDSVFDDVEFEVPAFIRRQADAPVAPDCPDSPGRLVTRLEQLVLENEIFKVCTVPLPSLKQFIQRLGKQEGISPEAVWAALLDWLLDSLGDAYSPARQVRRMLRTQLKALDGAQVKMLRVAFAEKWPSISLHAWGDDQRVRL